MKKFLIAIGVIVLVILLSVVSIFLGWFNTWKTNKIEYVDQKIECATSYESR